jgi:CRP-like cAMP-binding protein
MKLQEIETVWHGLSSCDKCPIQDLALFADLSADDFALIHKPIEDVWLPSGGVLYRAGEPASALFTVREGLLKLEQYLPDGAHRILRTGLQGDVLGLEATVADFYEHTAVAIRSAHLCRIPKETIDALSPKINPQLMQKWHDSVQKAHALIRELTTGHARQRMARLFLTLAPLETRTCRLFGREDVGALLGVTTETASKTVAKFKRLGVIREVADNVFERNIAALERLALGETPREEHPTRRRCRIAD